MTRKGLKNVSGKIQHYDAFISYRHAETDSQVAVALHRKLERFRLPKNLRKNYPKERWKINRVFRDQDELPLADNLSDPIEAAIRNSDFLIVICTPRLPESKWCAREIELFKSIHGQDHIMAILAEGEPEESFPEAICYRDIETTDENGQTVTVRESVEPLAADVRADSPRKRNKLCDDAVLRMVAPMYGLGYDDLKQRHREQKIRRIAAISAIAAGIFFVFGMVCMFLTMKIHSQKTVIEQQHEELQTQYTKEQIKFAESMTVVSDTLMQEGRQKDAVYAVYNAMPHDLNEPDKPYVVSTQYALSKALGTYESNVFFPADIIPIPADEEADDFWGDPGEYRVLEEYLPEQAVLCAEELPGFGILVVTSTCHLYVYEEESATLLDYTHTWFADEPDRYVMCAAYRDETLYLQFSDADYVAVYRWIDGSAYPKTGSITNEERMEATGKRVDDGEEIVSDDGQYLAVTGANHTVTIYRNGSDEPVKTLYDLTGSFSKLIRLAGTDRYLLRAAGGAKYSYLLNADMEILERIPYFHDYDPEKGTFILAVQNNSEKNYDLREVPVAEYDDLIRDAEECLNGYQPDAEVSERYKML